MVAQMYEFGNGGLARMQQRTVGFVEANLPRVKRCTKTGNTDRTGVTVDG